jgi:hypothetical protein
MAKGQVIRAVRPPVRLATRWIQVVSRASASIIEGSMVMRWRASLHVPTPEGLSRSR